MIATMKKRPVKSKRPFVEPRQRRRVVDPNTRLLIKQIFIGVSAFSTIALLLTGIWYGTRVEALTVNEVVVEGGQTISHSEIKRVAEMSLEGSYLGIVPKRFTWTYPDETIVTAVSELSRVKDPVIERQGKKILITIDEYIPFALWCDEQSNQCYFIDDTGYAFVEAPILAGSSLYRFVTLGQIPEKKATIRSADVLAEVLAFARGLENDFLLPVVRIELDTIGDAFFVLASGGEIKTTLTQTATSLLENLRLVLGTDEFIEFIPREGQYIDLRFGNKVFVNDEMPVVEIAEVPDTDGESEGQETELTVTTLTETILPLVAPVESDVEEIVVSTSTDAIFEESVETSP
jgi:cell division septal protein FtsQ